VEGRGRERRGEGRLHPPIGDSGSVSGGGKDGRRARSRKCSLCRWSVAEVNMNISAELFVTRTSRSDWTENLSGALNN